MGCWVEALENGPSGGGRSAAAVGRRASPLVRSAPKAEYTYNFCMQIGLLQACHTPCEATNAALHQLAARHG